MMYQFKQILKMDLKNLLINPMWYIPTIGLPFMVVLIMGFMTKANYGSVVTSYDFYGISMLVFCALNNATLAANSFMESRMVKANMRLCIAPVPSFFIYFPKIIASFIYSILCQTVTGFALFFIIGVNFGGSQAIALWFLMLCVNFFAMSLGVMLCCMLKTEEVVNQLISVIMMLVCLLGGTFFPIKGLGQVIYIISTLSPVTWMNAAAFNTIYGDGLFLLGCICAGLFALSLLWIVISAKCFNREDYL